MVLVTSFCFCSVRLGSIIVGVFTLVQASILLLLSILCFDNLDRVSEMITNWISSSKNEGFVLQAIASDPKLHFIAAAVFFLALVLSSIFLIFASLQCNHVVMMVPFLIAYLGYILILLLALIEWMSFVKAKENALGDLILYSNLGGFTLLFYAYTWACVLSFIQIINDLRNRLRKKLKMVTEQVASKDRKREAAPRKPNKTTKSYSYGHFT